jgi:hypothetical protein
MHTRFDERKAHAWLNAVPGDLDAVYEGRWERFAQHTKPTVTLYGAYDTGKSSLARRLIVDAGGQVPEWLTISARHETFEVNELELSGCILRDTPGFVPGASDVRADSNTELAAEAVSLTDVGVVVLTPQLATAEFPTLQKLVRSGWSPGSLWFVISRFDEAGIDPEVDMNGYRELAGRKAGELRTALNLGPTVPVFVVCQDFAQMAGSERNPARRFWDESREWDGMQALESAIAKISESPWDSLRAEAGRRYWRQALESTLRHLKGEIVMYEGRLAVGNQALALRNSWLVQVDDLRTSAEAELRGRVAEITGEAIHDSAAARLVGQSLNTELDSWYRDQERKIDKLLQSVLNTTKSERSRPSWTQLRDFVKTVRAEQSKSPKHPPGDQLFTPAVEKVAKAVFSLYVEYQQLEGLKTPAAGGTQAAKAAFNKKAAASAAVTVVEAARVAEKLYNRNAAEKAAAASRDAERARVEAELNLVGQKAATVALEALDPLLDDARESITNATADEIDPVESLQRTVKELNRYISEGNGLLAEPN